MTSCARIRFLVSSGADVSASGRVSRVASGASETVVRRQWPVLRLTETLAWCRAVAQSSARRPYSSSRATGPRARRAHHTPSDSRGHTEHTHMHSDRHGRGRKQCRLSHSEVTGPSEERQVTRTRTPCRTQRSESDVPCRPVCAHTEIHRTEQTAEAQSVLYTRLTRTTVLIVQIVVGHSSRFCS